MIVTMEHTTRTGEPKILRRCTLPLTGFAVVDTIVTELGVLRITPAGMAVEELAPGISFEAIQAVTEAKLIPAR